MREVALFYAGIGADPNRIAEECRDYRRHVPEFENLIRSTWVVQSSGEGSVSIVDNETGEEEVVLTGDGILSLSTYQSHFEEACAARDRAVNQSSITEYQSAVNHGIASLEAFLAAVALQWNRSRPDDPITDSKKDKVSFDDKIDTWIPKMTGGAKFEKGDELWAHFKQLRAFRDEAAHPKTVGYGFGLADLAKFVNMFRMGIAGMQQQLHLLFNFRVPAEIIRAFYMPDVIVVVEVEKHATAAK